MATSILSKHPPNKKLNTNTCPRCHRWTVKNASYCHNCGFNLRGEFIAHSPGIAQNGAFGGSVTRITHKHDYKSFIAEGFFITALSVGLVWSVANELPLVAVGLVLPLAVYALPKFVPALASSFAEVKTALAMRPTNDKPGNQTLKVEFVDDWGRPRLLADFHQSIQIGHLAWIGEKLEGGATFSRRGMCQNGRLSQNKFELITSEFLRLNYVVPKDPKAPNLGVILTERGRRLVKKAWEDYGDDFS